MNNTTTLVYHRAQINWGSKCKECKVSRLLIIFLLFMLSSYPQLLNTPFDLALSLVRSVRFFLMNQSTYYIESLQNIKLEILRYQMRPDLSAK